MGKNTYIFLAVTFHDVTACFIHENSVYHGSVAISCLLHMGEVLGLSFSKECGYHKVFLSYGNGSETWRGKERAVSNSSVL